MDDSGTKILVEDNQNHVGMILATLKEGRLVEELCVTRDGQEALDDLYDINEGLEVLQRIKADPDPKATPVVTLMSSREERDLLGSDNLGADACVVKSMSFRFSTETVNKAGLFWGVISTAEREI